MERASGPRRAAASMSERPRRLARGASVGRRARRLREPDLLYRALCALLYNYVPTSGHPGARSRRGASWPPSSSTRSTTTSPIPTATTPTSSRTPPVTRRWASTPCGPCATRSPALGGARAAARRRRAGACGSRTCSAFAATRPPRRRCSGCSARQGPRRPPDAGDALRAPRHRRLGRRPGELDRPRHRRPRPLRRRLPRASTSSRARAGSRRAAWRSAGGRRHGLARQRRSCTSTGTRLRSTATSVCREGERAGRLRAVGPGELFYLHDWNVVSVADGHDFQQVVAAQRRARRSTTASRPPSSTAPQGLAVRRRGPGLARRRPQALLRGLLPGAAELTAGARPLLPTCEPGDQRCAGPSAATRSARSASGRRSRSCAAGVDETSGRGGALRGRLRAARAAARARGRRPRPGAPRVAAVYELAAADGAVRDSRRAAPRARRADDAARRAGPRLHSSTGFGRRPARGRRPTCSARPA